MSILSPSGLETADYGTQGWNGIYTNNWQILNTRIGKQMAAAQPSGALQVVDPDAQTSEELTDSTTGTPGLTINDAGATYSQTATNDNNASMVAQINNLQADVLSLRAQVVALLAALREATGTGILKD